VEGRASSRPVRRYTRAVLEALITRYGYLAVLGLLLAAGVGVPIPEEPTQLGAGALAHQGYLSIGPAVAVCWGGIVAGDLAWFLLARRHGPALLARPAVRRLLTGERRARIEAHLSRHAFLTVMVARHLSGLRLPAFALAATHGVSRTTFLAADALSALLSVPLVVAAGYAGAHHLAAVRAELRWVELAALGLAALAGLGWVAIRRLRGRRSVGPPPP
jgi:membrane protein DedA with SNARE-associated domain